MTVKSISTGRVIQGSTDLVRDFVDSTNSTATYLDKVANTLRSGVISVHSITANGVGLVNSISGAVANNTKVIFKDLLVYFSGLESMTEYSSLEVTLGLSTATPLDVIYVYLTSTGDVIHAFDKSGVPDEGSILLLAYSVSGIVLMMNLANSASIHHERYTKLLIDPYQSSWNLRNNLGAEGSSFSYTLEGSSTTDSMMSGVVSVTTSTKKSLTTQSDGSGGMKYKPFMSTTNGLLQFAGSPTGSHGFPNGSFIGVTFYYNLGTQSILSVLDSEHYGTAGEATNSVVLSGYTHESALDNNFHLMVGKLVIKVGASTTQLDVSVDSAYWIPASSQSDMLSLVLKSVVTWSTGLGSV